MTPDKKFKIRGLKTKESFEDAANLILKLKLKLVFSEISEYRENCSPENLHKIRITLRRFRYNLEIFYSCIKPKLFNGLYYSVTSLLDILGELRDMDVLATKVKKLENDTGCSVPGCFYEKVSEERIQFQKNIQNALITFAENENVKKYLQK